MTAREEHPKAWPRIKAHLAQTENAHTERAVQDAESDQLILEESERTETLAAIQRGLEQLALGEAIPLEEAEARLRKKHGFSR